MHNPQLLAGWRRTMVRPPLTHILVLAVALTIATKQSQLGFCHEIETTPPTAATPAGEAYLVSGELNRADNMAAKSWFAKLTDRTHGALIGFVRPKRDYFDLFQRYQKWFSKYTAAYEQSRQLGPELLEPLELLAMEFADIDRELHANKSESGSEGSQKSTGLSATAKHYLNLLAGCSVQRQAIDDVHAVLEQMIERLELLDLDNRDNLVEQLNAKPHLSKLASQQDRRTSEEFRRAMDRMRQIGVKSAGEVAANEAFVFMRTVIVQVLAIYLVGMPMVGGSLAANLLASFSAPALLQYLAGVKGRALLGVIKALNSPKPATTTAADC
jgi:hypothetical protein